MQDILIILACIGLGMGVGVWQRANIPLLRLADKIALYAVYGLLFVLGARLGADELLLARLPELGGQALCVSLFCTAGSVFCLTAVKRFFPATGAPASGKGGGSLSPFRGSLRIILFFVFGIVLAYISLIPMVLIRSNLASYALYLLVFAVGTGLGADIKAFRIVRDMHVKILAVPLLIVAGTFAGSVAAWMALPGMSLRDSLCVGLGFGYYSLSSILIENAGNSALASVALMANIMREVTALLGAPLLARYCGGLSTVGAAGATAMDTTLPVIARFSGERCAVIAVFSGMTLTLLVPFLVSAALLW